VTRAYNFAPVSVAENPCTVVCERNHGTGSAYSLFGVLKGATAKIVLSCVAGAALGAVVAVPLALSTPETPAPSVSVSTPPPVARAAPIAPPVARPPEAQEPEPERAPAPPIATAAAAASSAPRTLSAETELLLAAQRELSAGQPERALALLAEHDRRHPRGVLAQERAASRVLALCAAGRTAEARAEAEAFVREAPGSPLVPRVRRSCAFTAPKSSAAFAPLTEPARPGQ